MEKDWNLNHLGFVVRDMNRAMKYYEQLGIADIGPERCCRHTMEIKSRCALLK